ncbi:MAG: hypothetical protein R3326_05355 [Gemmatimonadota bacterium]|nr:hypothetical protein [Gemmatimonadota bacterium]
MTAGASRVAILDSTDRSRSVRSFSIRNRGRRALLVVGYDGSDGHVVADLPLADVTAQDDDVRISMGDPRAGRARAHAVWDVDRIGIARIGDRDVALRLEYEGGRTILLLPRQGT